MNFGTFNICRRRESRRLLATVSGMALSTMMPLGIDAAAQSEAVSDEIVVTARYREESLQEVPIAITTVSGDQLERVTAVSLKDIRFLVPSLHYQDRSALQTELTIRGVGGDARNIGLESGVGLYIDGVYAGRTAAYNLDLADVAQIEVLRGPQGTLYGKNTTGGAINITTKKPTEELSAFATASYGNYDAVRFKGTISGAISDKVYGKLVVATWDRDGYLKNLFNGQKLQSEQRRAALAQLRFVPSDNFEVVLSGDVTFDDQDTILNQLGSPAGFGAPYFSTDRFVVNTDQANSTERDMYGASLSATYSLDSGHTLTSITSYRDLEITVFSDIDQTPLDIFRSGPFTDNSEQITQELRLASPGDQFLDYVAGIYYYRQDANATRNIYQNGGPIFFTDGPVDTRSFAGFINATANFTDKLSLNGGVRVTYEKKEGSYIQVSPVGVLNKDIPELRVSVTEPSWSASLNYRWTDSVSTYVSASNGFKSGGFNVDPLATPAPLTADEITFLPEFVTTYEFGFKSEFLEGKARLSGAVFYTDYKDRQVPQFEFVGGVPTVITRNAGEAEVKGFEVEFAAVPSDWFQFYGGISYLDGEYTKFAGATTGGADYTGNVTEKTPKWNVNLGAELRAPVGSSELVVAPQFAYLGETFLQPDNGPFNVEDGFIVFNVRAGVEFNDGAYGLYFWGKNLTDSVYKEFARQFGGSDQVLYGEPRTYGVEISAKF